MTYDQIVKIFHNLQVGNKRLEAYNHYGASVQFIYTDKDMHKVRSNVYRIEIEYKNGYHPTKAGVIKFLNNWLKS